jgi:hypothetical protein
VARSTVGNISGKVAGNESVTIVRHNAQTRKLTALVAESLGQSRLFSE